jgi:hypothetical protein
LKVPVGKSVYLSEKSDWIIYDVDNVTNTWDGDMVGKTWTMTEQDWSAWVAIYQTRTLSGAKASR